MKYKTLYFLDLSEYKIKQLALFNLLIRGFFLLLSLFSFAFIFISIETIIVYCSGIIVSFFYCFYLFETNKCKFDFFFSRIMAWLPLLIQHLGKILEDNITIHSREYKFRGTLYTIKIKLNLEECFYLNGQLHNESYLPAVINYVELRTNSLGQQQKLVNGDYYLFGNKVNFDNEEDYLKELSKLKLKNKISDF